jgi:hypothetical protein
VASDAKFKQRILELLKSDEEFRLAVAGLLGLDTIISELKKLREDFLTFVKLQERWWEETYKRFEAIEKKLLEHDKRFDSLERRLMALGTRWGTDSEKAFRNAMRGVIEEILGVAKVEKWRYYDKSGEVLGYPALVEINIAIKDQVHILIEVKSSALSAEVSKLWRIGKLYEKVTGIKPRLILATPFIDEEGLEAAKNLGVEVYTKA